MLVIFAIAALAILACVVLVSLGKGGELTEFPPDVPPLNLPDAGQLTAVDFMALELPVSLVGYHTQTVDETLRRAALALGARDTKIAVLEQRVSELLSSRLYARQEVYASPGGGPRTDHEPEAPAMPRDLPEEGDPLPESADHLPQAVDGSPEHAPAAWGEGVDGEAAKGAQDASPAASGDEDISETQDASGAEDSSDASAGREVSGVQDASSDRDGDPGAGSSEPGPEGDQERTGEPVRASLGKGGDERP